jgi:hypothetical protein
LVTGRLCRRRFDYCTTNASFVTALGKSLFSRTSSVARHDSASGIPAKSRRLDEELFQFRHRSVNLSAASHHPPLTLLSHPLE